MKKKIDGKAELKIECMYTKKAERKRSTSVISFQESGRWWESRMKPVWKNTSKSDLNVKGDQ